ncbi:MAG TPA: hypothetical protein VF855_00145, partial [Acidimicrobiales bacterium]
MGSGYDFVISRNRDNDRYSLWQFDVDAPRVLTKLKLKRGASLDRTHQIAAVGGKYVLEWGPL